MLTPLHSTVTTPVFHSGGICLDRQRLGLHSHTPEMKDVPFERQHTTNCLLKYLILADYYDSITFLGVILSTQDSGLGLIGLPASTFHHCKSASALQSHTVALCGYLGHWGSSLKWRPDHGGEPGYQVIMWYIRMVGWEFKTYKPDGEKSSLRILFALHSSLYESIWWLLVEISVYARAHLTWNGRPFFRQDQAPAPSSW